MQSQANSLRYLRVSPSGQGAGLQIQYREFESHRALQILSEPPAVAGGPKLIKAFGDYVQARPLPQAVLTSMLERAVRLELTNTGFAIRRLGRLATRAVTQTASLRVAV